jgi:hypothetical protein
MIYRGNAMLSQPRTADPPPAALPAICGGCEAFKGQAGARGRRCRNAEAPRFMQGCPASTPACAHYVSAASTGTAPLTAPLAATELFHLPLAGGRLKPTIAGRFLRMHRKSCGGCFAFCPLGQPDAVCGRCAEGNRPGIIGRSVPACGEYVAREARR